MRTRFLVAVALALFFARAAAAAGFAISEQGAAATARGGAVTASPRDPSALHYNPAGLAALDGMQAYVGLDAVVPRAKYVGAAGGVSEPLADNFYLPNLYATYRLNELAAFGLALTTPFGLGIRWPESSPGHTLVREQQLRTTFITPAAAFDMSRWAPGLAVGVGLDLVPASVYLERDIVFGSAAGNARLGGSAFGFGGRLGITYRPPAVRGLAAGLTYKSPVALDFSGKADFDIDPVYRSQLPPDGDASTSLTLPQSLALGVAYKPFGGLEVEVDGQWTGWSSYDELALTLPDGSETTSPKHWRDTFNVRVGAQYDLGPVALRAGYTYDPTPVPRRTLDFSLPDANRHVLTAGAGITLPRDVQLDLAVARVFNATRDTAWMPGTPTFKGRYEVRAWLVAASVGVAFGKPAPAASL